MKNNSDNTNSKNSKFHLYDYIPSGICMINKDLIIEFVNYTFAEIFTIDKNKVVGKKLEEIFPRFKEIRYKIRIKSVFEFGPPVFFSSQFHKDLFKQDKSNCLAQDKIFQTTITHVTKSDTFIEEAFAIFTLIDVTESTRRINEYRKMKDKTLEEIEKRKLIEKKLQLSKDIAEKEKREADKANRAKSNFLANMSHEFRTPLNAILGFTELLLQKNEITNNHQSLEFINSIKSSGTMLLHLVNDILDLSKIESGNVDIKNELVDLKTMFREIKIMFHEDMKKKGLDFSIEINSDCIPTNIYTDQVRFKEIILNLLSNAYKFTTTGFIKIKLHSVDKKNSLIDLFISIEDSGKGIEKDQMNRIFEDFIQHKGQIYSKYSGTGLGLSIVKNLLNNMNGEITLKSKLNSGSTFTIKFTDVKITENLFSENFLRNSFFEDDLLSLSTPNLTSNRSENKNIEDQKINNSKLSVKDRIELTRIIKDTLLPTYNDIKKSYNIKQIIEFSDIIIETSTKFNLLLFKDYGKKLKRYAESITLDKLLPLIELFTAKTNELLNESNIK